jgi:hypothetical protein
MHSGPINRDDCEMCSARIRARHDKRRQQPCKLRRPRNVIAPVRRRPFQAARTMAGARDRFVILGGCLRVTRRLRTGMAAAGTAPALRCDVPRVGRAPGQHGENLPHAAAAQRHGDRQQDSKQGPSGCREDSEHARLPPRQTDKRRSAEIIPSFALDRQQAGKDPVLGAFSTSRGGARSPGARGAGLAI